MTTHSPALTFTRGSGRPGWMALVAAIVAVVFATNVPAQAPAAPGDVAVVPSAEALDKLVGRIALYPDDLVAVILPASTFPLEIVQAGRFLEKRKADPKLPLDDRWDDSVKTLLNYPDVVKTMSDDLDWTSDLGEAVVADQGAVLEAIQVFRRRTQAAGHLKSDDKQTVVVEKEVITIAPSNPQVIYVPQYNPTTVVVSGGSPWGYYPAPYPSYYYPYAPGAAFATGLIWGAAIGAAWNGGRYGANYGGGSNNNINIDRSNNVNVNRPGSPSQARPSGTSGQSSQWKSNKQPGQVSSGRPQSGRVGDSGSRGGAGGFGGSAGGARPSTQPGGGAANRGGAPSHGGAFDGGGASGRQTHMDSSRGASSRAASPSAGSRQSSFGGGSHSGGGAGARSGGGGARAGGGGGGARGGGGGRGGRR